MHHNPCLHLRVQTRTALELLPPCMTVGRKHPAHLPGRRGCCGSRRCCCGRTSVRLPSWRLWGPSRAALRLGSPGVRLCGAQEAGVNNGNVPGRCHVQGQSGSAAAGKNAPCTGNSNSLWSAEGQDDARTPAPRGEPASALAQGLVRALRCKNSCLALSMPPMVGHALDSVRGSCVHAAQPTGRRRRLGHKGWWQPVRSLGLLALLLREHYL